MFDGGPVLNQNVVQIFEFVCSNTDSVGGECVISTTMRFEISAYPLEQLAPCPCHQTLVQAQLHSHPIRHLFYHWHLLASDKIIYLTCPK